MNRLTWYYQRANSIPLREYPYRLNNEMKKRIDMLSLVIDRSYPRFPQRCFLENVKKEDISAYDTTFPGKRPEIIRIADGIVNHHFSIFGIEKDFGNPINWHLDPKTNRAWPLKFWGDINYRDGETIGGIKFAWELNRLHHFPLLVIAYSLTKDTRYRTEIFKQLSSWIEANPYPKGINWIMGIELGIRITNIVYMLKFLGNVPLSKEEKALLSHFLCLHSRHLLRYPSKHSSCANHGIAEALGLFLLGVCFPFLEGAQKLEAVGRKILEREAKRQIYPDGSSFEHSVFYLQFVIDLYLVYYQFCLERGQPCSRNIEEKLKSSLTFISSIMDKKGDYPHIGDDDDGYLLKLWFGNNNNFLSILNTGAILFNDPAFIIDGAEFDQKTYFLLGGSAKNKWSELAERGKKISPSRTKYFSNAGLAVLRDHGKRDLLFIGNSGPLGLKPLSAHGHADALSFWLSLEGKPFFIDPGTYLYHGGKEWRNYFRSTSAHNTLKIDGQDQAKTLSDFIYKDFYEIINPVVEDDEDEFRWSAGHDGYMKGKDPVFHKREVVYKRDNQVIFLKDIVHCRKKHFVEGFFHFHPDISVVCQDYSIVAEWDTVRTRIGVDKKWKDLKIIRGSKKPQLGWYSQRFNHLQETQTVRLATEIEGNEELLTEIFLI